MGTLSVSESSNRDFTRLQKFFLVVLRVAVGWHFLYEGIVKLADPNWSSAAFLAESKWVLAPLFHWIAASPPALYIVDLLNIWGLILIGAGLMLGFCARAASLSGILLLALYYSANPPFVGYSAGMPTEGRYLIVDKNLIELLALCIVTLFPTSGLYGLDRLSSGLLDRMRVLWPHRVTPETAEERVQPVGEVSLQRRDLIRSLATVPVMGGFVYEVLKQQGWQNLEERHLASFGNGVDTVSSATVKSFQFATLKDLKGQVPVARIGNLEVSRIFLGGNLMGGWAHSRDLIYVSKLVKSYHTDQKVFDTLRLAERCGVNTLLTNPQLSRVINKYWRTQGGRIQFISDCGYRNDAIKGVDLSIEGGAHACYVQGEISDRAVREGRVDDVAKAVEYIRGQGLPAGIGAHSLATVKECVRIGLKPDFWVKTLHHCNYWSARPDEEYNDNVWCTNPDETVEFMSNLEVPWIAFKVLAAGAIHPNEGFKFAFENGADFICVGMYDFQIVEDVNITLEVLASRLDRRRPWMA